MLDHWKEFDTASHPITRGIKSFRQPAEKLTRCLVQCQQEGKRLGAVLVEQGILDREVVERTLAEQIEDLIRDIFLWDRGIFFFQADQPPAEKTSSAPFDRAGKPPRQGRSRKTHDGRTQRLPMTPI